MVANFNSTTYQGPSAAHGEAAKPQTTYWLVNIPATAGLNDTIVFGTIPINARIHGAVLKCTDMDTGTPALTIDVGDAGNAVRYFSASTAGQAGTVDSTMAPAGRFYKTTAKTIITGLIHAAAATPAAGTIELSMTYVVEDAATS